MFFFFFKQKTAYEMRISDWSSDVCSSDLHAVALEAERLHRLEHAAAFVDVLDGELVGAQFVGALVGIGTGQRNDEGIVDRRALGARREIADWLVDRKSVV